MARRPDEGAGSLIFQEGRCIDGEYYIIAVYDDPSPCNIMFSAYELENDSTYTYPLTYSEFDNLFRFDSELMNPSNQDGRFHWVIERLDFIINDRGEKMLCLAQEPTNDEEELFQEADVKKSDGYPPAQTGRIDAATRARLLKELDTQDDQKLHSNLVRSEEARKLFLADLHSKRQLEQLKATQRLVRADEEREARLQRLEIQRQQQEAKAMALKAEKEAKESTMAQLEVLMKQKEAAAIRRLIQEKEAEEAGMGKDKDATRQKRQQQEKSAKEAKRIEAEKARNLDIKRAGQVAKWEAKITKKSRAISEKCREKAEELRAKEARMHEKKERLIADMWREKGEAWLANEEKRNKGEAMDETREMLNDEKDKRRARLEKAQWDDARRKDKDRQIETDERRNVIHVEALRRLKVEAMHRATAKREQARREAVRQKKINEITDARMRKFRERQYLEQAKASLAKKVTEADNGRQDGEGGEEALEATLLQGEKKDSADFQETFEFQQRAARLAGREEMTRKQEAKREKLGQMFAKDPKGREIARIEIWRQEDEDLKQYLEKARLAAELRSEQAVRQKLQKDHIRVQTFEQMEKVRREKSREREEHRNEAARARIRNAAVGASMPTCLSY